MSLQPVAARLSELLGAPAGFAKDCIGPEAERAVTSPPASRVVLLENLRFHAEEEKNDAGFAKALAALADVYVNDAFGAAHRAHASVAAMVAHFSGPQDLKTSGPQALNPSSPQALKPSGPRALKPPSRRAGAGLLMEKELRYLGMALGKPERPFVAV